MRKSGERKYRTRRIKEQQKDKKIEKERVRQKPNGKMEVKEKKGEETEEERLG